MRIIAYTSPDAPERERWLAYIFLPAKGGEVRLPTWFSGTTKAHAQAKALAWWTADQADRAAKAEKKAERDAARKRPAAQKEIENA